MACDLVCLSGAIEKQHTLLCASTSALALMSILTISMCPFSDAVMSEVQPSYDMNG